MSFASLGLSEALVRAIEAAGYTQPTPVQQRAIPAVLQGRDLMVAAQTGTGKTGGFALPILERLFPAGEGAGYAGGILSAAIDGIKAAEAVAASINR